MKEKYTAEQEITEFNNLIFGNKQLHKATPTKCFNPKTICKAAENMNSTSFQKCYAPDAIE